MIATTIATSVDKRRDRSYVFISIKSDSFPVQNESLLRCVPTKRPIDSQAGYESLFFLT